MPVIPVSDGVIFEYNTVRFNSTVKTVFTEEPVPSEDGRVIKYSRIRIDVTGYLSDADAEEGESLDDLVARLRRKLQVKAKPLYYVAKGIGELKINTPDSPVKDIKFGPTPSVFSFSPLGGAPDGCHAGLFTWSVTAHIPECLNARYKPGRGIFSQISYTVTYEIDHAGLVTITTRGTAEIPMTLSANNRVEHNIDEYFADLVRQAPDGFRRTHTRTLSMDRANVDFTIKDTQIERPLLDDCIEMDIRHRVAQQGIADTVWEGSISGAVRLTPTANKSLAWARFFAVAYSRMAAAWRAGGRWIRLRLEFDEDVLTNTTSFVLRYRLQGVDFTNIIERSGLWRPLIGNMDAKTWSDSLRDNAHAPTGVLNARYSTANDIVIDPCHQTVSPDVRVHGVANASAKGMRPIDDMISDSDEPVTTNPDDLEPVSLLTPPSGVNIEIDPNTSWISWVCEAHLIVDHHIARHKPLAGSVNYRIPKVDPFGDTAPIANDKSVPELGFTSTVPDVVQQVASPSVLVRLRGGGVRDGFRVNAPKLLTYGGKPAVLKHENVSESSLPSAGGVIYKTEWDLIYIIPDPPTKAVPIPTHPMLRLRTEVKP